jgi:uncharacterized protein (TIGR02996 family)
VQPPGEPIRLPDGSGLLVFGRSARCTIVFDDARVSQRHCELAWESGFWRLRDLGSDHGTWVNDFALNGVRALFAGDVVRFGDVLLRFEDDLPKDDPALLAAISRDPEAVEPWLVYADQLEERGDPLGERIARSRTGGRVDHQPWVGHLWEHLVSGALEIDWHLGFARRVTLRTAAGRLPLDWRAACAGLFNLRIGRFVRDLVVDVPRLDQVPPGGVPEALVAAQRWLAAQPSTPSTLRSLLLGYHVGAAPPVQVLDELVERAPRLRGALVYLRAAAARLRMISHHDGVQVTGLTDGVRLLSGVVRVRRGARTHLHLESPPGIPFLADGNPCYFAANEARTRLIAGRMRGEVRVNQRIDALYELLPGDLIDVQGTARFRFEVA